jgi:hypothetical protein
MFGGAAQRHERFSCVQKKNVEHDQLAQGRRQGIDPVQISVFGPEA